MCVQTVESFLPTYTHTRTHTLTYTISRTQMSDPECYQFFAHPRVTEVEVLKEEREGEGVLPGMEVLLLLYVFLVLCCFGLEGDASCHMLFLLLSEQGARVSPHSYHYMCFSVPSNRLR